MYLLYASKEVLILRINFVIVIVIVIVIVLNNCEMPKLAIIVTLHIYIVYTEAAISFTH